MDKEFKQIWSLMLGKKKPSKETISFIESQMIKDIVFETPYIEEFHDSILIKYQGTVIAGLLPKTQYNTLTPWGNFEKFLGSKFWTLLAEKLVVSYETQEKIGSTKLKSSSVDIVKKFSKVHNEEKSNRSSGDYSELKTIEGLCSKYNLPFIYNKDLEGVIKKIKSLEIGEEKLSKEDKNLSLLIQGCCSIIDQHLGESITEIEWLGRCKNGTEDILVKGANKHLLFSLKSIAKTGSGTLKNLGASTLEQIGVDISSFTEQMKSAVIKEASVKFGALGISEKSKLSEIKDLSRTHEDLKILAEKISAPYIESINKEVLNKLLSLSQEKLHSFINTHILDYKEDPLWVVVANEQGLSVWNQNKDYGIKPQDVISFGDSSSKGFKIQKNEESFIRINTCCTNGKGLSSPCLRIFFDD